MSPIPVCPKCASEYVYEDGGNYVCPDCAHEWSQSAVAEIAVDENAPKVVKDAHGHPLADGDTIMLVKDLKLKGYAQALKTGTKAKNIRLVDGDHDIECRLEGYGSVQLKSEFVKKIETKE